MNTMNSELSTVISQKLTKKILAAQETNKTNTKKTYWGSWFTVRSGMNAAFRDYGRYQELENEWLALRSKLSVPEFHYAWELINKRRVTNFKEPNATLRFIKNVRIRIAAASEILEGKHSKKDIMAHYESVMAKKNR